VNVTVDASVAAKWILKEEEHPGAMALLTDEASLHAPTLLLTEVGNVIWRRARAGRFTTSTGRTALAKAGSAIDVFHPLEGLVDTALRISLDLDHPIYDCVYLACAEQEDTALVTADRRLATTVAGSRFSDRIQLLS
jgi:predicted nucleic acid-binding protein